MTAGQNAWDLIKRQHAEHLGRILAVIGLPPGVTLSHRRAYEYIAKVLAGQTPTVRRDAVQAEVDRPARKWLGDVRQALQGIAGWPPDAQQALDRIDQVRDVDHLSAPDVRPTCTSRCAHRPRSPRRPR